MAEGIRPVYVLCGTDPFLRDQYRTDIIARAIGQADPQLCVADFDGTADLADVLDELRTTPFLSARRVVVVRDADAFVSAHRQGLESYLNAPAARGTLILIVSSWPSRARLHKLVTKIGKAIECSAPNANGLVRRLAQAVSKRGKDISPDAADLLIQWVGRDLGALHAEIEKLSVYVGRRGRIEVHDVSALVTASAGPGAFDLTNALTAGHVKAALKALDGMLVRRGDEFRTLGLIAWHLRRAVQAQQLLARSGGDRAMPPMPPSQRTAFLGMLRRRPLAALEADFRRLIRADLALKSGAEPKAAMQPLVVELCA